MQQNSLNQIQKFYEYEQLLFNFLFLCTSSLIEGRLFVLLICFTLFLGTANGADGAGGRGSSRSPPSSRSKGSPYTPPVSSYYRWDWNYLVVNKWLGHNHIGVKCFLIVLGEGGGGGVLNYTPSLCWPPYWSKNILLKLLVETIDFCHE